MSKKKERVVYELPEDWNLNLVAAWRVFERALNPAFAFKMVCGGCGAEGTSHIRWVMSKKNPKAILGMECTECLTTVKFEGTIDPDAESFPDRLLERPETVLGRDGKVAKGAIDSGDWYLELLFDE